MSDIWRNSSGDLIRLGGDLRRSDICTCELAPPVCPCSTGSYPPSWPCGGLTQTYSVDTLKRVEGFQREYIMKSAQTVTSSSSCTWTATDVELEYYINGAYQSSIYATVRLRFVSCQWQLAYDQNGGGSVYFTAKKETGQDPTGSFTSVNASFPTLITTGTVS